MGSIATWIAAVAVAATPARLDAPRSRVLRFAGVGATQAAVLADRWTALFVLTNVTEDLSAVVARQGAGQVTLTPLPRGKVELEWRLGRALRSARAVARGGQVDLIVELEPPVGRLRDRLRQGAPREAVARPIARQIQSIEAAIRGERWQEATRGLERLSNERSVASWARLRLADLRALQGDQNGACAAYRDLHDGFSTRLAGLVGALRAWALVCADRPTLDFGELLGRSGADEPAHAFLRREVVSTLEQAVGGEPGPELLARAATVDWLPAQLRAVLLARSVRYAATPFAGARACVHHRTAIGDHPEAPALALQCAEWLAGLDLLPEAMEWLRLAAEPGPTRAALWRQRLGSAQVYRRLAELRLLAGDAAGARRALFACEAEAGEACAPRLPRPEQAAAQPLLERAQATLAQLSALRQQLAEAPVLKEVER